VNCRRRCSLFSLLHIICITYQRAGNDDQHALLVQCCVCRLSVVCDVMYCG